MTTIKNNFVSCHIHQQSLDSASTLDDFLQREIELNTGALVCTDHGYLGACRDVYDSAKKNNLTPILGIEAYHQSLDCDILKDAGITDPKGYYKYGHLLLHAKNQKAYEALVKKVSDRDLTAEFHGSERKPIFTWEDLEELGQYDMTMSSGCLIGIVSRHIMADRLDIAEKYYEKIRSIPKPGNFIVEIFPHKCDKNWVSGAFITLSDGRKLKYYLGKKVRTEEFDSISVVDLAKAFKTHKKVGKLTHVNNSRVWTPIDPAEISEIHIIQDFIENECRPWAPTGDLQAGTNKLLIEWANKHGDPVLISDDAHYAHASSKIVQDAKLGGMGDSFRFYGNYHRHTSDEAFEYFSKNMGMSQAEFEKYVDNSRQWAAEFKNFTLDQSISLPKSFYPKDTLKHVYELIEKHGRAKDEPAYKERLAKEIELLHNNGTIDLLPYFFLAEDSCAEFARQKKLSGPGRGSSAGLLLNYYLEVTHVDPLKHGLSLDRFLTIDRVKSGKMPDIDMDFSDRECLTGKDGFLSKKFGACFAQVSTNNLLRVKSAIKDVCRFKFGEVTKEIEDVCSSIKPPPQGVEDIKYLFGYTSEDGKEVKGHFFENEELQRYAKKYPDHWEIVIKILKVMRSKGSHASAFIIADKPIDSFIPLMTIDGNRVTQYTASGCESSGGLKMDYLNVNSVKDIESCIKIIQEKQGLKLPESVTINGKRVPDLRVFKYKEQLVDVYDLPNSKEVFDAICEGRTETVFQLGTNSAQIGLRSFNTEKPNGEKLISSLDEGGIFVALDRPGPLDAKVTNSDGYSRNMLEEYAFRARGKAKYGEIEFLTKTLPKTYGIMVFQEDLTKVYRELTGCSGVDAENFRSDIGKKKMDKVNARYPFFKKEASKLVGEEVADSIWNQIVTFGQYGFNLSHAVSYFYVSYATAFLKEHFPLEWWCAVLKNAKKDEIVEKFWPYCYHMVTPPNIDISKDNFVIENEKIIAPLTLIKGLGPKAHKELVRGAPYKNIQEFTDKIATSKSLSETGHSALNAGVVNRLILTGVMDSLFSKNLSLVEKLEEYQRCLAISLNKKRPDKVKEKYLSYNHLQIYQAKKQLLEIYSEPLLPIINKMKFDGVNKKGTDDFVFYTYYPENAKIIGSIMEQSGDAHRLKPLPFITGAQFRELNKEAAIAEGQTLRVAIAAYVEEEKSFQFNKKNKFGEKTSTILKAKKYIVDIDGVTEELVKFPDFRTDKLTALKENVEKGIIIMILSKRKELTPFRVDAIIKVQDALGE